MPSLKVDSAKARLRETLDKATRLHAMRESSSRPPSRSPSRPASERLTEGQAAMREMHSQKTSLHGNANLTSSWSTCSTDIGSPSKLRKYGQQGPRGDFHGKMCGALPDNEVRPGDYVPEAKRPVAGSTSCQKSEVKQLVFRSGDAPEGMGAPQRGTERPTKKEVERDTKVLLGMLTAQMSRAGQDSVLAATQHGAGRERARKARFAGNSADTTPGT
jgi:hypothetical protein